MPHLERALYLVEALLREALLQVGDSRLPLCWEVGRGMAVMDDTNGHVDGTRGDLAEPDGLLDGRLGLLRGCQFLVAGRRERRAYGRTLCSCKLSQSISQFGLRDGVITLLEG